MISRSFISLVALLTVVGSTAAGCKSEAPEAKPEPSGSAAAAASGKPKLSMRNPVGPVAKVDPQAMKEYRADLCYFGSLTLRQARDAYVASLGKDEPGPSKIPSLGIPKPPDPKDREKAKDDKKDAREARRPLDLGVRAPHERNARNCTVAASLKEPAMPDIDASLTTYGPYAVELAKNIVAANNYYQRDEHKKDSFAKGKELHTKLMADFAKLDEASEKLGAAIAAWRKDHPADLSKVEEGQKVAQAAFDDGRALMLAVVPKKPDVAGYKAALEKLTKSAEAVKTFGTAHAADPWPKMMNSAFDAYLKAAKDAEPKVTEKGVDGDTFLSIVTTFTALVEAKHRALSRAVATKNQPEISAGVPAGPAGVPQPVPTAAPQPPAHDDHPH